MDQTETSLASKKLFGSMEEETLLCEETACCPSFVQSPVEADFAGIGIFNAPADEVKKIMDEDPAIKGGVLVYEVLDCQSFPGDCLP